MKKLYHLNGFDHTSETTATGNTDFLLQRGVTGEENLHTHSPPCVRKIPSTNKQDKQHQKNGKHTDKAFKRAVSEALFTRIYFLALFHSICMRTVQDSYTLTNCTH